MDFNWIDVVVFILLVIFTLKGYRSGLINQLTTIIAIILGIYIAAEQYNVFADFLQRKFEFGIKVANIISFGVIILFIGIFVNYIGRVISQMLDLLLLSFIDDLGGALFGLIKGGLIAYILILMIVKLGSNLEWTDLQNQINQSYFIPKFLKFDPLLKKKIDQFL
ncbi:putative membrane protein, required for colicin V production [Halobacteroides halobius DSM 5150]|uniref:Putative membrane protein, required for colicin V production n=1 Tax=Halobacteroides halobius (strain ATCC 35273 / DSM 5150 / MD-1) TaxID=748449 RepID=L0KBP5_HALHC|nr:CvpA family protein [Halobacteroides halobius]AGB41970.1 putative membrane protein, required for colicin V production [Halobacteroides halobius DSM 5150]